MDVLIKPSKLKGTIKVPPSKSLAHRAIIAASLAKGNSVISNVSFSEDIKATIEGMKALGAKIRIENDKVFIEGSNVKRLRKEICANESGSTLRFLIPIALVNSDEIVFTGKNNLVNRPLDIYFDIFKEQGIEYKIYEKYLPLEVKGALKPGEFKIRGDISSQFITGLLFALPLLNGDSKIFITTELESRDYILLTIDILNLFGIKIEFNEREIFIKGNQVYQPFDYEVEGDFSQAAFYLVANMLGADVKLAGLNLKSVQGDIKILEDIESFGGKIVVENNLVYAINNNLKPADISFKQTPDLGPALTVLASITKGVSNFKDCARLRIKECDRVTCMKEELNKLGASITESSDTMTIRGSKLYGGIVDSHNDHRVVMALAMLTNILDSDILIKNANAINKSYPNFFEDFKSLGGIVYEK